MPDDPNPERPKPPPFVPSGWSWPTTDGNFIYWWRSVLRHHCAEHLLALKETADFHAVFLLRFCYLFQLFGAQPDVRVPGYVAAGIKAALLQFKYWWDEPAADSKNEKVREMTFWSENHQIQFHASQFLAGQLFLDDVFPRSGFMADGKPVTGREHLRRGRERLERWLNRRLALGFSEWNAPGYYNEDFPAVLNVVDFSLDETIATKAAMVADLLVFDLARNTCRGSFGVTAGRAYFEHKAYGWEQSVGETIEVLFGTRGDHLGGEATAIALCTSPKYQVPDALLAIGRDRLLLDQFKPMEFRARVSIDPEEAQAHGIGFESDDDAGFWWGLGAYFDPKTLELTRGVARRNHNIHKTNPPGLLFKLDIDLEFLDYFKALLQDAAGAAAGGAGAAGTSFLLLAPFPLNIVAGIAHIASIALLIEGLWNLIEDLAIMIKNSLEVAWDFATGQDPPKPDIPQPALQRAWEAMLQTFNAGNMLSRANLYTYSVGDAMLSSAQNHRAKQISLQKQPWLASLGCDACVWTNAPMDPDVFGSIGSAGWEVFKHLVTAQFTRAAIDIAAWGQVAGDELKEEGLRDWGGSICLPKVVQHRGAAIIAYEFPDQRSEFSAKLTHAWFPSEFFDEVTPAPENEDWLTERDGGGTWVFGRKDDGYIALCSARRVKWLRDNRFKDDPTNPISTDPVWEGRFTSTELRAENGSNIWICAIGNRTQFGSFELFAAKIRAAEVHFSGVGTGVQLQCTFDMPAAPGTGEPGFRWELFFGDDEAHLNGVLWHLDDYPRFEGRYVAGLKPGRVEWGETSYKLVHPITGLWVSHDTSRTHREIGPSAWDTLLPLRTSSPKVRAAVTLMPIREAVISTASPKLSGRARRFRLKTDD